MSIITTNDLTFLKASLVNKSIPKPSSGTLSGHAAGEPFDKFVEKALAFKFPNNIKRQYSYLNELFLNNPLVTSLEGRANLIESSVARFLLMRGKDAVTKWNENNLFEEKQNDTADILYVEDSQKFTIIDVKTTNLGKDAQAPNIISSEKLAKACKFMIDKDDYDSISIIYIGIDWELNAEKTQLVCKDVFIKDLFKSDPTKIYINWAAALQIQFKVQQLEQNFQGTRADWCKAYIKKYATSFKEHTYKKLEQLKDFEKYIT